MKKNTQTEKINEYFYNTKPWQTQAKCLNKNPNIFFPRDAKAIKAKKYCSICPVKNKCLKYALENIELHGIWGGTTPEERKKILGIPSEYQLRVERKRKYQNKLKQLTLF